MINRVIINGYLGKDPEIKKTNSGKSVCNFSISQSRKDANGNQIPKWYQINAWEKQADFLGDRCKKGDMILVDGHMDYREWEQEGRRRYAQEIIADTITIERFGQNHVDTQPQQTYQPQYTQQSMMPGSMIPKEVSIGSPNPVDDYGIPYSNGIDISADDLPF